MSDTNRRDTDKHFGDMALAAAAESPCDKRKVGAIIVDAHNMVVSKGFNHNYTGGPCEDNNGNTKDIVVIHAEVAAIEAIKDKAYTKPLRIYCTHPPCDSCHATLKGANINNIIVVEQFMKFDGNKLRYDLIPVEWTEGLAEVLTAGARKYKPNNWRKISQEDMMKYYAAAERHMQAWRKAMEGNGSFIDGGEGGTNTHHLKNAMVNLGFLLTLTLEGNNNED